MRWRDRSTSSATGGHCSSSATRSPGVRRFGEFQRSLGVAKNILTNRLKSLVAQGILEFAPDPEGGAHQEYVPTEKGRALLPVLVGLAQWGSEHLFDPDEPRSVLVDAVRNRPLAKLQIRSEDGATLRPDEVLVRSLAREVS